MNSFNDILQRMVESVEGATGAVFVDFEGEAVGEFARDLPQLEIRIVGAQWGVVWAEDSSRRGKYITEQSLANLRSVMSASIAKERFWRLAALVGRSIPKFDT